MIIAESQIGADPRQIATMPFLVIKIANGGKTLCFNFAGGEASIIVVLTTPATVFVLVALLSFVILREATTRRTWLATVRSMPGC